MVAPRAPRSRAPAATTITAEHALQSIATLRSINDDRLADRANVLLMARDDSDDDVDSPAPIYHSYLDSDPESVCTMTNFGPAEFERLWTLLCDHVTMNWNTGRGKKCTYSAKDVLFMLLTVLKNCGKWDVVAAVFRVKPPSFQKMVAKFAVVVPPFLYERLVTSALDKFPMKKMVLSGQVFANYPYARYASDVTFQQSNMPSGRMHERTLYYTKKHHLHGYKVEVSVLPNGQAVSCTRHYPGNEADVEIFRKNAEFHLLALRKAEADADIDDEGRLVAHYPTSWAVLADKGYQGLAHDFRAITPHKHAPLQQLTLEQVATNERIAHDQIVVENYFGRLCSLWAICADKYRWDEDRYDVYFQACVALTNFHIRANPLRRVDGKTYARYLQRLREIGESIRSERREIQQRYRENRRNRLNTIFAAHRERVTRLRTPRSGHRETPGVGGAHPRGRARRRLESTPPSASGLGTNLSSDETDLSDNPTVE